jgi:hypothetical protein
MDDCQELLPHERADCYRAYAVQARASANNALTEEIRQAYLQMAADWLQLADNVEAHYGRVSAFLPGAGTSLHLKKP